jgi:hypothetical protein
MKDPGKVQQKNSFCRFVAEFLAALAVAVFVCTPAAHAQFGNDTARIATMAGRVSVERGGELWAVNAGQAIDAGQVIVTGSDGSAQLALPDGSQLDIFPNSRIVFRANQFNLRDLLDVYLGKVRLQIQHILPGETPLRVTSPTAVISVRGTVFEVEVDPSQVTVVSVDTGAVSVRHRLIPGQEIMVEAGQSVRVSPTLPLMASTKPAVPVRTLGRVARAVVDTLAQINSTRASNGGHPGTTPRPTGGTGGGSTPTISGSDSGSNEPAPPPGGDNTGGGSDNTGGSSGNGGSPTAPPGDQLP